MPAAANAQYWRIFRPPGVTYGLVRGRPEARGNRRLVAVVSVATVGSPPWRTAQGRAHITSLGSCGRDLSRPPDFGDTDEQYADYRPWFDNARRAKDLFGELEAVSLAVVEADPRSTRRRRRATSATAVEKPRSRRR